MKHLELFNKAKEELKLCDHMIYITLPLLNDKRLFLTAVDHLHSAVINSIIALFEYERYWKRIRNVPNEPRTAIHEFIKTYSNKLNVGKDIVLMINELNNFNFYRKKGGINLQRKDKFIVISPNYETISIDEKTVKKFIIYAKELLKKIGERINEHGKS